MLIWQEIVMKPVFLDPNLFLYLFNDGSKNSLGGNDNVAVQKTGVL